jgi:hypothetical protein
MRSCDEITEFISSLCCNWQLSRQMSYHEVILSLINCTDEMLSTKAAQENVNTQKLGSFGIKWDEKSRVTLLRKLEIM